MDVSDEIEGLYEAFGGYRLGDRVVGCRCCVDPADEEALVGRPLRRMTARELQVFAGSALYTWGTERDFKHFLPRILELIVTERAVWVDPQTIITKLPYAHWTRWPKAEQEAVEQFVRAVWKQLYSPTASPLTAEQLEHVIAAEPWKAVWSFERDVHELDTWLECLGILGVSVALDALGEWLAEGSPHATAQLAKFVVVHGYELGDSLDYIWWERSQQAADWFLRPAIEERLTAAFAAASNELEEYVFASASDILFNLRRHT